MALTQLSPSFEGLERLRVVDVHPDRAGEDDVQVVAAVALEEERLEREEFDEHL